MDSHPYQESVNNQNNDKISDFNQSVGPASRVIRFAHSKRFMVRRRGIPSYMAASDAVELYAN